ncbi:hypothetical protein ACQ676_003421 [Vibrio fluvialis]
MSDSIKSKALRFICSSSMVFINFLTTLYIARTIGFNEKLDVYYLTLAIYLYLMTVIGWALSNVLTPLFIKYNNDIALSKILCIVSIWIFPVCVMLFSIKGYIISIVFQNYEFSIVSSEFNTFFSIAISIFFFDVIAMIFVSYENSISRFNIPIVCNFISSLFGLVSSYALVNDFGVLGALISQFVIKISIVIILSLINLNKLNFVVYDRLIAAEILNKIKYFILSGIYFRTDDLLEKYIASFLVAGQLSLVSFVQRIYGAIITIVNTVIITPTLTKFCNHKTDVESYDLIKRLLILALVLGGVGFGFVHFFGVYTVRSIFPSQLNTVDTYVYKALMITYPTSVILVINQLLHNYLLSRSQEKNIAQFDVISFTISAVLKIILTIELGFIGFLWGILFSSLLKLIFKMVLFVNIIKNRCSVSVE